MRKSWAYAVEGAGRASAISLEAAPASFGVAPFVWVHLYGRDEDTLEWLRDKCGIPYPVFVALTAAETRPRGDFLDGGALINLRGLGSTPADDPDALVSIRLWAEAGRVISTSFRSLADRSEEHTYELQSL